MTRYMKFEDVLKALDEIRCSDCSCEKPLDCALCQIGAVHRQILTKPVYLDVVPKSEVDDLKRYIILNEDIAIKCKRENGEQNEEYWKGKISAFKQTRAYIDTELKKKYTESGSILGECTFSETIHPEPLDSYDIRFVKPDGDDIPPNYEAWESLPPLTIVGELSEEDKAKFLDDLSKGCLNLGFLFEKLKVTSIREESEDSVSDGNTEST